MQYCRVGIYRATKISRKADFSVFRVYLISRAIESSTAPSVEQNSNENVKDLVTILRHKFPQ